MASKGRLLRELLNDPGVVIMPGVYDGFSARLVEAAGFLTAGIWRAGLSETNLGSPDVGIMGYDANLKASSDLAGAPRSRCSQTATSATATRSRFISRCVDLSRRVSPV